MKKLLLPPLASALLLVALLAGGEPMTAGVSKSVIMRKLLKQGNRMK